METKIYIKSDFETAYLINGNFTEGKEGFFYNLEEPLYITVLPLDASMTPYTIKLVNQKAISNKNLCQVFWYNSSLYIKFSPRNSYFYSNEQIGTMKDEAEKLFLAVKEKNEGLAKSYLTKELSSITSFEALGEFFAPFNAIVRDSFNAENNYSLSSNYYLINEKSQAVKFVFTKTKNGLIDDIQELE